ncbi:hypothetical protein [Enterovibrio sp. FF113]|uniref:hypothetical protein n=1 Tax=Enterovibrio sp. FF113 TaxID=3230010 RepID=UPI00352E392F
MEGAKRHVLGDGFYKPTVLADMSQDMAVASESTDSVTPSSHNTPIIKAMLDVIRWPQRMTKQEESASAKTYQPLKPQAMTKSATINPIQNGIRT